MELGTREYPYRTFQAVMSEIINFFSNSEASLTILTKSVYVENQMANFMNMTLVTVTTHPDLVRLHERALVVPTAISQPEFMEKSRFHLLNSQPTDISQVIADGEYTDVELDLMNRDEYGIAVVRTGFTLSNIDFFQEEIEANLRYQMITVIRLDDKTLTVVDLNANVTGSFLRHITPSEVYIENIIVDIVKCYSFFNQIRMA